MQRFKNILMVLTGRETDRQTIGQAAALAVNNGASLSLLEVIEVPESEVSRLSSRLKGRDLAGLYIEDRKAEIEALLAGKNLPLLRVDVVFGIPFITVIRHVHRYAFDLVIMTAEGEGGLKQKLFGTTSLNLIRKCPCPLWVLKPSREAAGQGRILAAVDPADPGDARAGLNRKIMELAASLAAMGGGELHVVHVWEFFGESLLLKRAVVSAGELDAMVEQEKESHRQALDSLALQYPAPGIRRELHLLRGVPGEVIPGFAEDHGVDLIVMGTVSRQGLAGFLIGNTAEQVIQKVDCSVLTIKPDGFVSPVQ